MGCMGEIGKIPSNPSEPPPPPVTEPDSSPVDGAAVYSELCASCHGVNGEGSGSSPSLQAASQFADRHPSLLQFPYLVRYNDSSMPFGRTTECTGVSPNTCAFEVSRYIYESFLGTAVTDSLVLDRDGNLIMGEPPVDCAAPHYGPRQIKLLSRHEIQNTLQALVGITDNVTDALPSDFELGGFTNQVNGIATQGHVQAYFNLSQQVATQVQERDFAAIEGLSSECASGAATDLVECQNQLLDGLGRRLFRRPLTDEERADFRELLPLSGDEVQTALSLTLTSLLNAPGFLYRTEVGVAAAEVPQIDLPADTYVLTGYEIAALLSFSLTGSAPDDALLAKATSGALFDADEIRIEASRLLDQPGAGEQMGRFATDWLGTDEVISVGKSSTEFPAFTTQVRSDMKAEVEALFNYILFSDRSLMELVSADYAVVNSSLAEFYGLGARPSPNEGFVSVDGEGQRGGILRTGAFLAANAGFEDSSLIQRAVSIRRNLMCQDIPPPADAVINGGRDDALTQVFADYTQAEIDALTTREYVELQTSPETCAQCHATMINPLGAGLEAYDAVGRFRTADNGKAVDASGALIGLSDVFNTSERADFSNATELNAIIATQRGPSRCLTQKALAYMASTELDARQACVLAPLADQLHAAAPLRTLFESLGTLDTVRFRR